MRGSSENRMVLEQNVDAVTLYISPFILRHHQRVFAARQNLTHSLAVGICWRSQRLVAIVVWSPEWLPQILPASAKLSNKFEGLSDRG